MGYGKEVYNTAMSIMNERHSRAVDEMQEHKTAFYAVYPRAAQIEQTLSTTAITAAKAVLGGKDVKEQLTKLKESNLSLQAELKGYLKHAELPEDYIQAHFQCKYCEDTGFIDGQMCDCFKKLLRIEAYKRLNALTPLSLSTFDSFSLKYYPDESEKEDGIPPKKQMEGILRYCRNYAESFSNSSSSIIMQGGTGLGKTHLSLAIANAAIDKGFGVIYGSAQNMVTNLERERFSRDDNTDDTNRLLLGCDLLILDDLGTEFATSFVNAAIYNIVNTRLMAQKPTIISTNLSIHELEQRYTERFVSRVIGSYVCLKFCGKDVRQQKRMGK
ncbi:MAG TPA: ATP-binding protein [Oscillospiraceae bacterium]|nr:ATP-binding protein [Oscillospiraceae bacterium]